MASIRAKVDSLQGRCCALQPWLWHWILGARFRTALFPFFCETQKWFWKKTLMWTCWLRFLVAYPVMDDEFKWVRIPKFHLFFNVSDWFIFQNYCLSHTAYSTYSFDFFCFAHFPFCFSFFPSSSCDLDHHHARSTSHQDLDLFNQRMGPAPAPLLRFLASQFFVRWSMSSTGTSYTTSYVKRYHFNIYC